MTSNKDKQSIDENIETNNNFQDFWKAIGVDPNKTPDHITLGDIGLESLFSVKLQQEFNRAYSINVSVPQIKIISVQKLKEYEGGNKEYLRQFFDDLKLFQQTVTKYKYIMPNESYVRLNNVIEGKPIYFLAPFEITFSTYKQLAERMDRPVIGINWTKHMNSFEDFNQILDYYSDILQKLEPKGKYDLLGSFDGMFVILDLLNKGLVNRGVAIDVLSNNPTQEEVKSDDLLFEVLLGFLSSDCPDFFKKKLAQIGQGKQRIRSRIRRFVQDIKEIVGRQLIATDMEGILQTAVKRIKLITVYQAQIKSKWNHFEQANGSKLDKHSGQLFVIKPVSFTDVKDLNKVIEESRHTILFQQNVSKKFYFSK